MAGPVVQEGIGIIVCRRGGEYAGVAPFYAQGVPQFGCSVHVPGPPQLSGDDGRLRVSSADQHSSTREMGHASNQPS